MITRATGAFIKITGTAKSKLPLIPKKRSIYGLLINFGKSREITLPMQEAADDQAVFAGKLQPQFVSSSYTILGLQGISYPSLIQGSVVYYALSERRRSQETRTRPPSSARAIAAPPALISGTLVASPEWSLLQNSPPWE